MLAGHGRAAELIRRGLKRCIAARASTSWLCPRDSGRLALLRRRIRAHTDGNTGP